MYKITVPIMNMPLKRMGREKMCEDIKKMGAERVFLALGAYQNAYHRPPEQRAPIMAELKDNCAYFHDKGFEVGAWLWTFMVKGESPFIHMQSPDGKISSAQICPSDANFREFAAGYIKDIAACGVDLIMYDDDYRYGFHDMGMGCTCENHVKYMEEKLGESLKDKNLSELLLSGEKNKYRSAWLEANGYYLKLFAQEMREALNTVNPNIRFGLCSCMSLWDTDGVDAETISRILAGGTKPFMRLIGAPYWATNKAWGNRLQNVIELERMERSWCKDDIEIFSEGDVWPRPRHKCPANYLEIFDTALRADGGTDGILKYVFDYTSNAGYESGYLDRHIKNKNLYAEIEKHFSNKTACGVRIYERKQKFADMKIPESVSGTNNVQDIFFSVATRMMSDNSIPTVYNGLGTAGIAFAENITEVSADAMKRGIIIDLRAAEILSANGIDTGILSFGEKKDVCTEYFEDTKNYVSLCCTARELTLSENAVVSSKFITSDEKEIPGSYFYKNNEGHQFFVFAFDAYFNGDEIYRSYERSHQLKNIIEHFGNGKLPAYSYGNPDFYIMTKRDECSLSVGMWNIFADEVLNPVIELDEEYESVEFINCSGKLEKDKVYLSEIQPFAFAAFTVKGKR